MTAEISRAHARTYACTCVTGAFSDDLGRSRTISDDDDDDNNDNDNNNDNADDDDDDDDDAAAAAAAVAAATPRSRGQEREARCSAGSRRRFSELCSLFSHP